MTAAMEKEREAFEKWFLGLPGETEDGLARFECNFGNRRIGEYIADTTRHAFDAWLARSLASPQVPEWIAASQPPPLHLEEEGDPTEVSAPLLVVVNGAIRFGGCYRGVKSGRVKYQAQGHLGDFTVTHWMDLESLKALLPEEKANANRD